ncbi:MAG TPA: hypothetical protein PL093_00615 [Candidatus Pacearchaeota archaeon]|jgi:predicted negative regulator of RcsB-dependent stress response|nr:hypothetical protein [Candidatus Pacearchaeota archaeon]HRR94559.1 hypothetical protein [Candidatus Paceibacterota bacterium]HPC30424.1 hypothetical protein [Candidatus Pacearchaeota archaeon]HQG09082.1 hypothetical protein [Candidatus Pacearchaeota archaeon]HQH20065.1 hypothetical protein [Candidatus Pacearchaeota archaeon]
MLTKITNFVKKNQADIILALAVILIALLSFGWGYLSARADFKPNIIIEKNV